MANGAAAAEKRCLSCGGRLTPPVFEAANFPASAQDIPSKEELARDHGISLALKRCERCGLHQLDCAPVPYYKNVIRAVGLSDTMKALRREDCRHLTEDFGLKGGSFIECGCGNGDFLKVLSEFPVKICGIENDERNVEEAKERLSGCSDTHIYRMFPDSAKTRIPGAPFDCFLSFNFLEHQPDPLTMLRCMFENLRDGGMGLITVPSFEYILREAKYYELIRDHIANYTLSSLAFLCESAGFEVAEKGTVGIGDTLRMIVRKPGLPILKEKAASHKSPCISLSDDKESVRVLEESYMRISESVSEHVKALKSRKRKLAMWGAGHQGFTIASTTELRTAVSYIIDSAKFKQGLYAPASHIPIVPPEHFFEDPADVILVAAPGYVKEISENIRRIYAASAPEIISILDL